MTLLKNKKEVELKQFETELRNRMKETTSLQEIDQVFTDLDVVDKLRSDQHWNHHGKDVLKDYLEDGMNIKLSENYTFENLEAEYPIHGYDCYSEDNASIIVLAVKYQIFNDIETHMLLPYSKKNMQR